MPIFVFTFVWRENFDTAAEFWREYLFASGKLDCLFVDSV